MAEYDTSQLDMLDLGYASTIHKSQGSEYRSVIINLQCAHYVMLTRPLVYTAITRGKENVIIVGERPCFVYGNQENRHRKTRHLFGKTPAGRYAMKGVSYGTRTLA